MVEPRKMHWVVENHELRLLQGIIGFGLRYVGYDGVRLHGYSNLDWESSVVDRKSTYGSQFVELCGYLASQYPCKVICLGVGAYGDLVQKS
jgi:hypothetical protein